MALPYEIFVGLRYLRAKRRNRTISLNTFVSVAGITLGVAALIGTVGIMTGFKEDIQAKILGTTLTICYFSITSLACSAAFEKKRYPLLFVPGLVVGIAGFLLFIPGIWAEWFEHEPVAKTMAVLGMARVSSARSVSTKRFTDCPTRRRSSGFFAS